MSEARSLNPAPRWILFAAIAVAGLLYVKWLPYWDKAFVAASSHSIGQSILMGKAAHAPAPSWDAALAYALAYGKAIWKAMVLGLLLGSGAQALLPADWIARLMGRTRFGSAVAGGLLALPGMMCTCCAAPVVVGLRRQQASAGGAIAFWLGNSVLNPATLVFMGFVLGWRWAALRLVLGVPMVFGLGYLANRLTTAREAAQAEAAVVELAAAPQDAPFRRWLLILGRMTLRLVPEYIVLVLLLGAGRAWLFPALGPEIGNHIQWIAAFAVAGALFVIPTAGEVPIIQAMLALGVGAGPAGALLMTLPPISLPSMAMLSRAFPPRILAAVAGAVVLFGLTGGALAVALRF
ncbi:permease [Phenylobacterium sp.]|uniref:permease n=1 Tax=Phenylobacterium sp. TaxID=1871053 RepID=UPI0011FF1F46|nr:permease [Phenylobacterium sp.]THD60204.1 MAG: permease [Phenylobacterium sp.]